MHEEFWITRWQENRIGFHEERPNALLVDHFHHLKLKPGSTVFVPLCGKSVDLDWLLSQGHQVKGVEFSEKAVREVFARLKIVPAISKHGALIRFISDNITLFAGDFFALDAIKLGTIDAVYDRAALVALPGEKRPKYARHLSELSNNAPQLLVAFDYEQEQMDGPPFSVPGSEITQHYGTQYQIEQLAARQISGHLATRCTGKENTWLLKPADR